MRRKAQVGMMAAGVMMAQRIGITLIVAGLVGLLGAGCGEVSPSPRAQAGDLEIAVSVAPLAWAARGLAPEGAQVTVLVPPGSSPHGWEMTPSQAAALRGADLVVVVGLGMTPSVERAVEGDARALRFAEAVGLGIDEDDHDHEPKEGIAEGDAEAEAHGHALDPHLWLDPALMAALVRAMHDRIAALQESRGALDDAERARLAAARDTLLTEIAAMQDAGDAAFDAHAGAGLLTVHDAWERFATAFGLRVAGVLQHAGELEPSPAAVAQAVALVRNGQAQVIVVEPQFSDALARRVASETGAPVAALDPLGNGDWPALMRANIEALALALEGAE